jgi:hypothetical protein
MTFHLDRGSILSHEITSEGFLRVYMRVARLGELKYRNFDGTERIEVVTPDVLFSKDSMDSFKMKPITLGHPPSRVTAENARQYQRGMTGHYAIVDGDFLGLVGTVTDQEAIEAILAGRAKELSCGYDAEVRKRSDGKYEQVSRKGNHIAAVEAGRAGPGASFRIDSSEPLWIEKEEDLSDNMNNFRHDTDSNEDDRLNAQLLCCGALSWMGGGDRNDWKMDSDGTVQEAQQELVKMIESASKNVQRRHESRSDVYSDRATAHEDAHEDAYSEESAIKKAQREMVAEIEAQSRQHRR